VFGQRHKALDADLGRTIHGFDARLVLTGSMASANPRDQQPARIPKIE
jgi:hypothetical protein